jgi:hypothetical protein
MVDNKGEANMQATYVEQNIDDCMAYMRVENDEVIEIVNQLENYGIYTQYQRHWDFADSLSDKEKALIDGKVEILTEEFANKLKAEFIAAGGKYVEEGVAPHDHESPNDAYASDFENITEQLADYTFCDYDTEIYNEDYSDGEDE